MGGFVGTMAAGTIAADVAGAVPVRNSSGAKTTADGALVSGGPSARGSLYASALIVIGALAFLLIGARVLRDARIA